jgi:hypothetical protein
VVIVTGYGTQANEQRAKAAGVSAFLNKPLSPEMIEQSAAAMLAAPAIAAPLTEPAGEMAVVAVATHGIGRRVKNIALFFTAPFIGLAYAVMLPFVGIAMLVGIAVQAMRDKSKQK